MKNNDKQSLIIHIEVIHNMRVPNTHTHIDETGRRHTEQNTNYKGNVNKHNDETHLNIKTQL